jgi:hypothetical protein
MPITLLTSAQASLIDSLKNYLPGLKKKGQPTDVNIGSTISDLQNNTVYIAKATYDFAVNGGAIGTVTLPVVIPANAVIMDGMVDVLTTFTTAGANAGTVAIQVEAANDIVAAIAVSNGGNPWNAGRHDIVPVGTAATSVKTTVARNVKVVLAVQNVTAGKMNIFLRYMQS